MSTKAEKLGANAFKLEITVDAKKFDEGMKKSFAKNASKFNIPGFRKGKAPRNIVENYYGEGVLYEDAFDFVAGEEYEIAISENNIKPVGRPEIDIVQIGSGKDLIYTAVVYVKPEFELPKYKGIEIEKIEYNVTAENIDAELEKLRQKNSRLITVEDRALKQGDLANIDFEGFLNGVAFPGGKGLSHELEIGGGQFIPGFEEQLIDMKIGETKDIKVTFPEQYHSEDLAGKETTFTVKLNSIKEKELPALDDEFAKDVSEFETLEELKKDIEKRLSEASKNKESQEKENKALAAIADSVEIDIPQVMVESEIDALIHEYEYSLNMQGLKLDKFMQYLGKTEQDFRKDFEVRAKQNVKYRLIIESIAEKEGFEVNDDEIAKKYHDLLHGAHEHGDHNCDINLEEIKQKLAPSQIEYIKEQVKTDKVLDLIIKNIKFKK